MFLLLLLGHFIADFILQTNTIANKRCSSEKVQALKWNIIHSSVHLAVYAVLLVIFKQCSLMAFCIITALSIIHFAVDLLKSFLISIKPFTRYSIAYFLFDQALHIASIYFLTYGININGLSKISEPAFEIKVILTLLLLVIGLWVTGIFISKLYDYIAYGSYKKCINSGIIIKTNAQKKDSLSPDISFMIGLLERLLVICSIVIGLQDVIGFVLATKSIARFKEFDDRKFVINFIIGSFISFLSAIIIGVAIRSIGVFNILLYNNK